MLHHTKDLAERAFSIAWKKSNVLEEFNETLKELVQTQSKKTRKEKGMSYEKVKFRKPVAKKAGEIMRVRNEYNRTENKRAINEGMKWLEEEERSFETDNEFDELRGIRSCSTLRF